MSNPMQKWIDYGKSADGLRYFSKELSHNRELGGGYAIEVLESAAKEMERLRLENSKLTKELQASKQQGLL